MTAPALRVQRWQPAEKAAQEQSAACGTCGTRLVFDHEQATGRAPRTPPPRRTHCLQGHEFTAENTVWRTVRGRRERHCGICEKARRNASYARTHPRTLGAAGRPPRPVKTCETCPGTVIGLRRFCDACREERHRKGVREVRAAQRARGGGHIQPVCVVCTKPLPYAGTGKPRKYCDVHQPRPPRRAE